LIEELEKSKIGYGIYYPVPVHKQKPFKKFSNEKYIEAERASREVISLPIHPTLTKDKIKYIAETLLSL
jgi:dTDP-4-amino-4,6-dideoxygalactose transaminase